MSEMPAWLSRVARQPRLGSVRDAKTKELRAAHNVLAEFYAVRLADALDHMPEGQAVLGLFRGLVLGGPAQRGQHLRGGAGRRRSPGWCT